MEYISIKEMINSNYADIKTGPFGTQLKASEYVDKGTPVLNVKNLGYGQTINDKLDYVNENTTNRLFMHLLKSGDIVFGRKGAVDRHAYITDDEDGWMQGSDCIRLRILSESFNPRFLSYYFMTKKHRQFMEMMCSHGTTMSSLNQKILEQITIPYLDRKVQNTIVSILQGLDDRIANNKKINQNLQEQARAIYSNMIVDNADDTWTQGTLSDVALVTMGQSPKGDTYNEDGNGTVFFQGRAEFGFRFPTRRLYTTDPKRMAQANDALMSVRAPVGDMNVAYEDCCIGRGLSAIRSKDGHQSFVLYTMFDLRDQLDVFNGEGTVFGSINRDALNSMPISIPPKAILDSFETVVAPMDQTIRNNYDEICRLTNIRDSLLPRLMSGELDVSEIDI